MELPHEPQAQKKRGSEEPLNSLQVILYVITPEG